MFWQQNINKMDITKISYAKRGYFWSFLLLEQITCNRISYSWDISREQWNISSQFSKLISTVPIFNTLFGSHHLRKHCRFIVRVRLYSCWLRIGNVYVTSQITINNTIEWLMSHFPEIIFFYNILQITNEYFTKKFLVNYTLK